MRNRSAADRKWAKGWRAQCRRQLGRGLKSRLLYGFVRTYKPVLDDAPFRVFNSMAEYRDWCEKELPKYLGYYRVGRSSSHRYR